MKRALTFAFSREELTEIVLKHLEEQHPELKLEDAPRFWTDIETAQGYTLIDDEKCPEKFLFTFADAEEK